MRGFRARFNMSLPFEYLPPIISLSSEDRPLGGRAPTDYETESLDTLEAVVSTFFMVEDQSEEDIVDQIQILIRSYDLLSVLIGWVVYVASFQRRLIALGDSIASAVAFLAAHVSVPPPLPEFETVELESIDRTDICGICRSEYQDGRLRIHRRHVSGTFSCQWTGC